MLIAALLAAGLAWWMHRRGELVPNLARLVGTAALAFAALRLLEAGQPLLAATVATGAVLCWRFVGKRVPASPAGDVAAARATLGLDADADADAIRAAHRRLIAQVHPDKGGSADLAQRVTAARDLLLERLAGR